MNFSGYAWKYKTGTVLREVLIFTRHRGTINLYFFRWVKKTLRGKYLPTNSERNTCMYIIFAQYHCRILPNNLQRAENQAQNYGLKHTACSPSMGLPGNNTASLSSHFKPPFTSILHLMLDSLQNEVSYHLLLFPCPSRESKLN